MFRPVTLALRRQVREFRPTILAHRLRIREFRLWVRVLRGYRLRGLATRRHRRRAVGCSLVGETAA